MRPEDQISDQGGLPLSSQPAQSNIPSNSNQEAAARLVRSQIDSLYDSDGQVSTYDRTASPNPQPQAEDWKKYQSAWQSYYQKYYEGYYTQSLRRSGHTISQQVEARTDSNGGYFGNQQKQVREEPEALSQEEAIYDLRQKLLGKVKDSATKVRKSRHFVPIAAAIIVVLIFGFLQYNRLIISNVMAYVSPGNIDPQNIVIDPSTDVLVGPEPKLIIPKINVDVPVLYGVGSDYDSQMAAMANGVAHFSIPGANSVPGRIGNTVLSGHSSSDFFDGGDYKFIFVQLDKLQVGDTIYANYKSERYTYTVTKKDVVKPTDVNALIYKTDKPMLTLITCTPIGTAQSRLLITAEQVSPDYSKSTKPTEPDSSSTEGQASIPGNTSSFFERIFGRRD